jgi:hypothetical protein
MAKVQTLKVSFAIGRHVPQEGFAYWDEGRWEKPLGSRMMVVNALPLASLGDFVWEWCLSSSERCTEPVEVCPLWGVSKPRSASGDAVNFE